MLFPGLPHHITQRGNHRERVFFSIGDHAAYLDLLRFYASRHGVRICAYCLMPNHVHLVAIPICTHGLQLALKATHGQYAQRINRMNGLTGHLWQGRFFSSTLDDSYFRNAVRYVELNPVRAGIVASAEDYLWSSAPAHCGSRFDALLAPLPTDGVFRGIESWSRWLRQGLDGESLERLRQRVARNLPCGSDEFVSELERIAGRKLEYRPRGGQRKPRT